MTRKRVTIAVAVVAAVGLLAAALIFGVGEHRRRPEVRSSRPATSSRAGRRTQVASVNLSYRPGYVAVPVNVPGQASIALSFPSAALEAERPPAPAYSTSLPPISLSDRRDGLAYATAFTDEVLDISFSHQTRTELAAWAQAEAAAEMWPGIPIAAAQNTLYASLFDPRAIGSGNTSPVPSPRKWASDAQMRVVQRVFGLTARYDRAWQQRIGQLATKNIELADPLMTVVDVSGVRTVTTGAGRVSRQPFELGLELGSALHHPGYGVSAVQWKVDA